MARMRVYKTVWRDCYMLYTKALDRLEESNFWNGFFWPRANAISAKHEGDELCAGILVETPNVF